MEHLTGSMEHLTASKAEASVYYLQLSVELYHLVPITKDPRGASIPGAMETTFKCCIGAIILLITFGRSVQQVTRYRPQVLIVVRHNPQTTGQAHLYHDTFSVCIRM